MGGASWAHSQRLWKGEGASPQGLHHWRWVLQSFRQEAQRKKNYDGKKEKSGVGSFPMIIWRPNKKRKKIERYGL